LVLIGEHITLHKTESRVYIWIWRHR